MSHTLESGVRETLLRKENVCLELDVREDSALRMLGKGTPQTHASR